MLISISFINIRILFYFLFCGVLKKKKKKIQYTRKDIRHDRDEINCANDNNYIKVYAMLFNGDPN